MKRFHLNLALWLTLAVASAAVLGITVARGSSALWIVAAAMGTVLSAGRVWRLVNRLVYQMSSFVKAIEMNDFTVKFPVAGTREMKGMYSGMNNIMRIYRSGMNELETRKLYYDRILRVMTHELRNSITPIVSLSADICAHPADYHGDNLREAMELIRGESDGIKRFLDSYYQLTHLPAPEITEVDTVPFFAQIHKAATIQAREAGLPDDALRFTIARNMTLHADADLLRLALANLLRNAIQAVEGVAEPQIELTASMPDGHPYITVRDNGCGMSADTLANLFQPFFTTKPEGTGIGLCLCRQIARLHGGDLRATSTPSQGSTFALRL